MGNDAANGVHHNQTTTSRHNDYTNSEGNRSPIGLWLTLSPKHCLGVAVLVLLLLLVHLHSSLIFFNTIGVIESHDNNTGFMTTLFAPMEQRVAKTENISIGSAAQSRRDDVTTGFKDAEALLRNLRVDFNVQLNASQSPWDLAAGWVSAREVVPEESPELGAVLSALATSPITSADFLSGFKGKQLKLAFKLSSTQTVAFKPKWYNRDFILEGEPITGRDRHNGEIAAFHLSRVLGFRRVPVTVGRKVRVKQELAPVASQQLLKTFYQKDGHNCFYGRCQNCVEDTGVCAMGDVLEGAIILWLPDTVQLSTITHPWYGSLKGRTLAKYPNNGSYCGIVRQLSPLKENSYLVLDIVDTAIFDFLIGNADRHHCEIISNMERGMVVLLDNGKSFGNPLQDEIILLAPLYECCLLRHSTWQRIRSLRHQVLGYVLGEVLKSDPLQPVLSRDHLLALDRRLAKVWIEIEKCIRIHGVEAVLVQDE